MWFKKPLPPIELTVNQTPIGKYPPRILSPGISHWLNQHNSVYIGKYLYVKFDGKRYVLNHENDTTTHLVNGQEFIQGHILNDGDFIQTGKWQGIFQANPVSDHLIALKGETKLTTSISPSKHLRKWVTIDSQGISIDGGKNTAKWEEIITLIYSVDTSWLKMKIQLRVQHNGKGRNLPSKLTQISRQEFIDFMTWVLYSMPFSLSTLDPNRGNNGIWTDAYTYAVYDKLILPAEKNQLILPASREKLLGLWTESDRRKWLFIILLCCAFLSLLLSKPTGFDSASIIRFGSAYLIVSGWFGFFALLASFPLIVRKFKTRLDRNK